MLALIATALQVGGTLMQGIGATRAAARNRRFANQQAADVELRGEQEVAQYGRELAQLLGRQRTAAAAQGLDLTQGSVATIAEQTQAFGTQDMDTIRENARRQAWGIRTQARLNEQATRGQVIGGLIAAGGQLATNPMVQRGAQTLLTRGQDAWGAFQRRRIGAGLNRVGGRMQSVINDSLGGR